MKSFSYDISPINTKNVLKDYLVEQLAQKLGGKDPSNASRSFERVQFGTHFLEQRIIAAAKAITYLFSPDIDLLENIEHNIDNYDKFQKTKMVLRELISAFGGEQIQKEVIKTSEQIVKLEWEIEELSLGFRQLERWNREKDEQIAKYRCSIIDLSKAYQEAKICYSDEILEQKYEIEELRRTIDREKELLQKKEKNQKASRKSKSKRVILDISGVHKKEGDVYTDRSIYKRFSASRIIEEQPNSNANYDEDNVQINRNLASYHPAEKYRFEKENLQAKIIELQQKQLKRQQLNKLQKQQSEKQLKSLSKKVEALESELLKKSIKLKQKNKVISQLLDSFQARAEQNDTFGV